MDRVGEIDGRGAARQREQIALGREAEHLVLEHLEPCVLEEFLGSGGVLEDVEELAQPAVLRAFRLGRALLVAPVRGDAELGDLVHLARADLHLDALALGPDHAGVQRAVLVGFRRRYVILEAPGHHGVAAVDHAERLVALLDRVDHHAERHDVGELLEADILALHLAPDRVGRFLAAGDLRLDAAFSQGLLELGENARHEVAAFLAQESEPRQDTAAGVGIELGESEILELVLHLVHADALGELRVDLHGLARDAAALVGILDEAQRAHVVQAVRELDQQHADVLGHRQHQLAEILGLLGLARLQLDARELGDPVHQAGDLRAEQPLDLFEGRQRVLDGVVQQPRDDRRAVEAHPREDAGDLNRMGEIGIARGALLASVRLHREDVGAVEGILIRRGIIGFDPLHQFELPHHGAMPMRPVATGRSPVPCSRNPRAMLKDRRAAGRLLVGGKVLRAAAASVLPPPPTELGLFPRRLDVPLDRLARFARLARDILGRRRAILGHEELVLRELLLLDGLVGQILSLGGRLIDRPSLGLDVEVLVLLGLVDLDVLLHALDEGILDLLEPDGLVRDLAQRHHGVFVVVPLERDRRARGDVTRPLGRNQHQLEAVRNLEDAVFNGYARHARCSPRSIHGITCIIWERSPPRNPRMRMAAPPQQGRRPGMDPRTVRPQGVTA